MIMRFIEVRRQCLNLGGYLDVVINTDAFLVGLVESTKDFSVCGGNESETFPVLIIVTFHCRFYGGIHCFMIAQASGRG